ncbi:MAG: hypothetical protein ABR903_10635 [Thermodesulfovibrionales bacterium]|jgi:arylsulfatase
MKQAIASVFTIIVVGLAFIASPTLAPDKKPNIVFIMVDDIGWYNIGAYHQGMMAGRTQNLDKMAKDFMPPTLF